MFKPRIRWYWLVILGLVLSSPLGVWAYRQASVPTWDAFDTECRRLRDAETWPQLARAAQRWSAAYPDRADPWLFRAEAAEGLQDLAAEADYLDRVPASDPRALDALIRKGHLEFDVLNRPWDAQRTCDRILEIDPRVLDAHRQSINFCSLTFQRADMVRRIRRAIRLRRESPESYMFLAGASWYIPEVTYSMNTHWLEADPDNETFQVARALHVYRSEAKQKPEHAADFAHIPDPEALLQTFPHNLELLAYFLDLKITDGDVAEVERLLAAAPTAAADEDARFWRARAWMHDVRGETEEAEQLLRRGFEIDPYWRQIPYELSQILRRTGRLEEAERFFEIHDASRSLSVRISDTRNPNSLELLQEILKMALLVDDYEVVYALQQRLSGQ